MPKASNNPFFETDGEVDWSQDHSEILGEIFKVQVSQFSTMSKQQVLIYNKSREIKIELPVTNDVLKIMMGRAEAFFYGYIEDSQFYFNGEAPMQDW